MVHIYRNEENLGYIRNFEKALSRCAGEIIFLCDQDDVWLESKINSVADVFFSHDDAFVVVNDAELTSENLEKSGLTVAGQLVSAGMPLESLLLGCCIAIRSDFKQIALPIPYEIYGHDGWINVLANRLNCRYFIPEVLQLYRRHGHNTSQCVTTRNKRTAKWKLALERIRARQDVDPIAAYEIRHNQLVVLKRHLESKVKLLEQHLAPNFTLADVNKALEMELKRNNDRRTIQNKSFAPRIVAAMKFFVRGGYRQFEGWQSLIRDIIR